MKVLGSIEWRAFFCRCREVVHLRAHRGWRMERFDKHQDINGVRNWDDLRDIFSGCQRVAKVPNAVEILPKI